MDQTQLNEAIASLRSGEVLVTSVRPVNGGKVQVEVAEKLGEDSLLQMMNSSDERFGGNARRGWISGQPSDIARSIPEIAEYVDNAVQSNAPVIVGKVGVKAVNGSPLCLKIVEATASKKVLGVPSDWEIGNEEKAAKRAGKEGDIIKHNGETVFSKCIVVTQSELNSSGGHIRLTADASSNNISATSSTVNENRYAAAEGATT